MRLIAVNLLLTGCLVGLVCTYFFLSTSPPATAANAALQAEIVAAETGDLYLKLDEASQRVVLACRGISVWQCPARFELPPRDDLPGSTDRGDGSGGFVTLDFGDTTIRFAPLERGSSYLGPLEEKLRRAWARTRNRLDPSAVARKTTGSVLLRISEADTRTLLRIHDAKILLVLCPAF